MTTKRWIAAVAIVCLVAGVAMLGPRVAGRFAYALESGQNRAAREELAELSQREQLSRLFRTVAAAVKPAVVEVRVSQKVSAAPMPEMDVRRIGLRIVGRQYVMPLFDQGIRARCRGLPVVDVGGVGKNDCMLRVVRTYLRNIS